MAIFPVNQSRVNEQPNATTENLLQYLIEFITKRACTVSWESPHPDSPYKYEDTYIPQKARFISSLKNNYPRQLVGENLKRIILDKNSWGKVLIQNEDKSFIPCYAAYIIKELGELDTIIEPAEVQNLLSKILEALRDSFGVYSPARDEALRRHYSSIRSEAIAGLVEIVKVCSTAYLHDIVRYLLNLYETVQIGNNLGRKPKSMEEIWCFKLAVISILGETVKKASAEDIDAIYRLLLVAANDRTTRKETNVLIAIESLAGVAIHKIPSILILFIKIIKSEDELRRKDLEEIGEVISFDLTDCISSPDISWGNIMKNISNEQRGSIRAALEVVANDQNNPDKQYAIEAMRKLDGR